MLRSRIAAGSAGLALLALLTTAAALAHERALELRKVVAESDAHIFVPAPAAARIMSFGANELAADIIWIRSLIYYGGGLNSDNGVPDVESLVKLMNALDPSFRRAYWWGAYSTTFRHAQATQEEYQSSVEILRRAVARFPDDWQFSWLLGLRLFFDVKPPSPASILDTVATAAYEKQREEGAYYMEHAMHMPNAASNLPEIAAAMRTTLGQKERGLRELREMILTTEDPKALESLKKRYAELASDAASEDLAKESQSFVERWQRDLPYVPPTLYVIVGPPPDAGFDIDRMAAGPEIGTWLAPFGH